MNAQDAADNILVDVDREGERDLLGNAGTAPAGIAPFHCYNRINEVLLRSLRTRPMPALGRKQQAILSFSQQAVEMQQSRGLQNDRGTENACWAHEKSAHAGNDTIRGAQVGRSLSATVEDQQLMPDQRGFGDNGSESSGPCQSGQGHNYMNEYDEEVAHPGIVSAP
jgi:hypothetical protein